MSVLPQMVTNFLAPRLELFHILNVFESFFKDILVQCQQCNKNIETLTMWKFQ